MASIDSYDSGDSLPISSMVIYDRFILIGILSPEYLGGERNRLLLARLFTRSFNLLVMDEPTNDLDMDTLELLEEMLIEFDGSLILVSHDRQFIDNTVTSTLVFDSPGVVNEYVGGYDDWLRQRPAAEVMPKIAVKGKNSVIKKQPTKLDQKQQKELKTLPGKIEKLEKK